MYIAVALVAGFVGWLVGYVVRINGGPMWLALAIAILLGVLIGLVVPQRSRQ